MIWLVRRCASLCSKMLHHLIGDLRIWAIVILANRRRACATFLCGTGEERTQTIRRGRLSAGPAAAWMQSRHRRSSVRASAVVVARRRSASASMISANTAPARRSTTASRAWCLREDAGEASAIAGTALGGFTIDTCRFEATSVTAIFEIDHRPRHASAVMSGYPPRSTAARSPVREAAGSGCEVACNPEPRIPGMVTAPVAARVGNRG